MRIVKRLGLAVFSAAVGTAAAALLSGTPVQATPREACGNTYCNPGWSHCSYLAGNVCTLQNGQCAGWEGCSLEDGK